jgi:hypothetical protein
MPARVCVVTGTFHADAAAPAAVRALEDVLETHVALHVVRGHDPAAAVATAPPADVYVWYGRFGPGGLPTQSFPVPHAAHVVFNFDVCWHPFKPPGVLPGCRPPAAVLTTDAELAHAAAWVALGVPAHAIRTVLPVAPPPLVAGAIGAAAPHAFDVAFAATNMYAGVDNDRRTAVVGALAAALGPRLHLAGACFVGHPAARGATVTPWVAWGDLGAWHGAAKVCISLRADRAASQYVTERDVGLAAAGARVVYDGCGPQAFFGDLATGTPNPGATVQEFVAAVLAAVDRPWEDDAADRAALAVRAQATAGAAVWAAAVADAVVAATATPPRS